MLDFITELLVEAGDVLTERRATPRTVERKTSQADLVSDADLASERCLLERLSRFAPDDAVLSEESGFVPGRSERTWIIDPLDGTTNFVAGLDDFGVIVGLIEAGRPVAGGMYLPAYDLLYLAESGRGATRNGIAAHVSTTDSLEDAILDHSLSYKSPDIVNEQRRTLDLLLPSVRAIRSNHSLRYIANVVDGIYDAFVYHSLSLWDLAGPSVILTEAGARVTRLDGVAPNLRAGPESMSRVYGVVAANPALHTKLTQLLRGPL